MFKRCEETLMSQILRLKSGGDGDETDIDILEFWGNWLSLLRILWESHWNVLKI